MFIIIFALTSAAVSVASLFFVISAVTKLASDPRFRLSTAPVMELSSAAAFHQLARLGLETRCWNGAPGWPLAVYRIFAINSRLSHLKNYRDVAKTSFFKSYIHLTHSKAGFGTVVAQVLVLGSLHCAVQTNRTSNGPRSSRTCTYRWFYTSKCKVPSIRQQNCPWNPLGWLFQLISSSGFSYILANKLKKMLTIKTDAKKKKKWDWPFEA